jgi:L-ascorbate oxidase
LRATRAGARGFRWIRGSFFLIPLLILAGCGADAPTTAANPTPTVPAAADELVEPPVLSSSNGVIDLLMIAKAAPLGQFAPYSPTGFVYEICLRVEGETSCPAGTPASTEYGGTRLQISPGDLVKIRLINRMPPFAYPAAQMTPGMAYLGLNPTNLHLHGMLVSPRYATPADPTWGDNIFVYDFNSANGQMQPGSDIHGTAVSNTVDYRIPIPASHPSGLFWFHPHLHGISGDQITAGLSGIITVGQVSDYACEGSGCSTGTDSVPEVRHLILKDTQILADSRVQTQIHSAFCGRPDGAGTVASDGSVVTLGQGSCTQVPGGWNPPGAPATGGRWFFTINGQVFPTLTIGAPAGQLLRIVNSSSDAIYDLNIWNAAENRSMLMQVVAIDGVSIDSGATGDTDAVSTQAGNHFEGVPCTPGGEISVVGVCTRVLHLMPSSRAEVWVSYRDATGAVVVPPAGSVAVLRTNGYDSGPMGDQWPAIDLAKVRFVNGEGKADSVNTGAASTAANGTASVVGQTARVSSSSRLAAELRSVSADVPADPTCTALPAGHKRRIFFGLTPGRENLGLGYEELDEHGTPVPGTFVDVAPFNPAAPTICLPLGALNQPAVERWELVNISGADHNFHVHQAHFSVVDASDVDTTAVPQWQADHAIMMDNLPLPHADGFCPTVADWRAGMCQTHPATVEITFAMAGDFVYHCHLLLHEDNGMMAVIRVRPGATTAQTGMWQKMMFAMGLGPQQPQQPLLPRMQGPMCRGARPRG